MELGVSSNMFDIKKNALKKLSKQQSAYRVKLLSSYKEMVSVTMLNLVNLGNLFSCNLESIKKTLEKCRFGTCHIDMITKKMAEEFVEMFIREVMIKGLLIMELISLSTEVPQPINNTEPVLPRVKENNFGISSISHTNQPTVEILQIWAEFEAEETDRNFSGKIGYVGSWIGEGGLFAVVNTLVCDKLE
ncbi:hypothetical protein ARALYDRAFT_341028 [Arabidopsis lyrata subsp. lyrata]|uniref:Uncharacterized protein n=1 Tax=Arabidopsis lyrata subsp. lyrata TaxID=81972 RepID=D7L7P0_ARALL|nr:hypothetical protein ARALYDRAFT_341028 [Arabidopsis lyrata subsp. lyrata]